MKKTADKKTPPKAEATAGCPPTNPNQPAPPGSAPDPEAVERLRALLSQIASCEPKIQSLKNTYETERQFFREAVTSRLKTQDYVPDTPVETLWNLYEGQVERGSEIGHAYRDLKEAHGRYEAAKKHYFDQVERRNAQREQLQKILNVEGPKLTVALREGGVVIRARAVAAIAPFCTDESEAEALADEASKVQSFILARFRWQNWGIDSTLNGASAFLNAWRMLAAALAAAAPLQIS